MNASLRPTWLPQCPHRPRAAHQRSPADRPLPLLPLLLLPLPLLGLTLVAGCGETEEPREAATEQVTTIRALVVDDPPLAKQIAEQWNVRNETTLEVSETTAAELLATAKAPPEADLIIYPSEQLGELAARDWLLPIDRDAFPESFALEDLWDTIRNREMNWNRQVIAASLGEAQPLLAFRRDQLKAAEIAPPETWEDVARAVAKLREQPPSQDPQWTPLQEPLGDGWAGLTLLARSAAYAHNQHEISTLLNFRDMKPRIATPPFVRALDELAAARDDATPAATPADAWRALLDGKCAMAITWPQAVEKVALPQQKPPIGFRPLPGARTYYRQEDRTWVELEQPRHCLVTSFQGRSASLVRGTRIRQAATAVVAFLGGPSFSVDVSSASRSTGPFRASHRTRVERWFPDQLAPEDVAAYSALLQQQPTIREHFPVLRIPGRSQYLKLLDQAVSAKLAQTQSSAEALEEAAAQWDALTEQLGRDRQKDAFEAAEL